MNNKTIATIAVIAIAVAAVVVLGVVFRTQLLTFGTLGEDLALVEEPLQINSGNTLLEGGTPTPFISPTITPTPGGIAVSGEDIVVIDPSSIELFTMSGVHRTLYDCKGPGTTPIAHGIETAEPLSPGEVALGSFRLVSNNQTKQYFDCYATNDPGFVQSQTDVLSDVTQRLIKEPSMISYFDGNGYVELSQCQGPYATSTGSPTGTPTISPSPTITTTITPPGVTTVSPSPFPTATPTGSPAPTEPVNPLPWEEIPEQFPEHVVPGLVVRGNNRYFIDEQEQGWLVIHDKNGTEYYYGCNL